MSAFVGRREFSVLALLIATVTIVAAINPAFVSLDNIRDMLIYAAPAAIVACGMTLVVLLGEIDISVGSLMGLLAAVLGSVTSSQRGGHPLWIGIVATLALGGGVGLVNGMLVTFARVPSIIATLGMLTLLQGVTQLVMAGETIEGLPDSLRYLGIGVPAGLPMPLVAAAVVIALMIAVSRETPFGRQLQAIGSNPHAARLAGLPIRRVKIAAFAINGLLTAIAALISVPQLSVIEAGVGKQFELLIITGVVVGGTAISGGRGRIIGSVLAIVLLDIVRTVLIFLHLGLSSTYWERAIQGAFILAAVLADQVSRRRKART